MSDTPPPPEASGADPTPAPTPAPAPRAPEAPRRKRPWTILGRLSQAVREQNWFAVVLELAIVVLGVVIGFQVTSWGQDRADRAQEQVYLRQLVEDLKQTEQTYRTANAMETRKDASVTKLVHAFRSATPPPADSVVLWSVRASWMTIPGVVTGTATALVETGDLNLIRDDSLRSSITKYIDLVDENLEYMAINLDHARPHIVTLSERVDFADARVVAFGSPERLDAARRANPMFPIPEAPQRAFAPLNVEALLQDREAYTAIWNLWRMRSAMSSNRRRALEATVTLREQIEAELNP